MHSACNNKNATITFARQGPNLFGVFTSLGYLGTGLNRFDPKAFIFTLSNLFGTQPMQARRVSDVASYLYECFFHDVSIRDSDSFFFNFFDLTLSSITCFAYTSSYYEFPLTDSRALAGSRYFFIEDMEVFALNKYAFCDITFLVMMHLHRC